MTRIRAAILAFFLAIAALVAVASPAPVAQAQTVITCSHGISTSTKSYSVCNGMYGTQAQQAIVWCQGFSWTSGLYTYVRYGNTARNGVFSTAYCNFGGATAFASSYRLV